MQTDELATLLSPFIELNDQQLAGTSTYLNVLQKWNSRINLTAVRTPQEIVTRHFGESFFVAQTLLSADYTGTIIDLGSGAGFPGIPMAMFAPHAQVTLIESNAKKAAFLNEIVRTLDLKNVTVFGHRAEEYPSQVSLVSMRAVEKFEAALGLAAGLVEGEGRLAVMIGNAQVDQARSLQPRWKWHDPIALPLSRGRVLLVGTFERGLPKLP